MNQRSSALWKSLLAAYLAMMVWLLFFREGYDPSLPYTQQLKYNLTPFATIGRYLDHLSWENRPDLWQGATVNLVGNVLMFIPLGFLVPRVFPRLRKFWKTLALLTLAIVAVELIQLVALVGTCDVDDLILNVAGISLGYPFSLIGRKGR